MTRLPKPGDRLLPSTPGGMIRAVSEDGHIYAFAPEVRITMDIQNPGGIAVAMWECIERNVCYIPITDLDPSTYVFSDEISDSRQTSTVIDSITPNDLGKLVRVSGKEKMITGYLVDIQASMDPIHAGASHPVLPYSVTEICLRSVSHYKDTTTVRIYSDDQIEFLDEDNK